MRNETRKKYNNFLSTIASLNGVETVEKQFTASPSVQQTLETRLQESSQFLSSINVMGVEDMAGEKLGLGEGTTLAGRTDTSTNDRSPTELGELDDSGYQCVFTEFDTAITYAKLDAWAKFPDFQTKVRDFVLRRQALDRIMIAFNGISAEAVTNRVTYPLLQDVNKGWLQQYRDNAAARVMTEGAESAGNVTVGDGGHYANLDAVVTDAVNNLVAAWHAERTDLVVIVGRQLLADKYFPLISQDNAPTEQAALDMLISQKRLGGLQAVRAPYFPDGTMLITPLDNLSIYFQEGKRRRHIEENAKRSRVENYESSNDAYVIEDYTAGCVVENIALR